MEFAESLMKKQGWKAGMGLGRQNEGRSTAIKVKFKFDSKGLGENGTEQFQFNWWDHMFNKAASNISVKEDDAGAVAVETTGETGEISKRSSVVNRQKNMFYLGFVKAKAEEEEEKQEKLEEKRAKALRTTLTDEELLKACDGRTGHKAARHGNKLSGKLARMEQADREFLARYGSLDNIIQKEEAAKPKKPKTAIEAIAEATSKKKPPSASSTTSSSSSSAAAAAAARGEKDATKLAKKLAKKLGRGPTASELSAYTAKREKRQQKKRKAAEQEPQGTVIAQSTLSCRP